MGIGAISSLLIVAGALVVLRFAIQWLGLGSRQGPDVRLRVASSCALGPRKRLHVVEAHGQYLLVGVSEQGVSMLRELPPPAEPAAPASAAEAAAPADDAAAPRTRRWLRVAPLLVAFMLLNTLAPFAALAQQAAETGAMQAAEAQVRAAEAASGGDRPRLTLSLDGVTSPEGIGSGLEALALLTLVAIAPSLLLMATCFTRIVIVLALLRQALGVQHLPPNQVLIGLSLFTTFFVMSPVVDQVRIDAYEPYTRQEIGGEEALGLAISPVRAYMLEFTDERDLDLFVSLAEIDPETAVVDVPLTTLLPAFVLSELRAAFEIGFLVYLPFLVIDLVIASMLISMGMIVLPPVVISLPFKLMLFVLLDGWNLVIGSVVSGLRV